MGIRTSGIDHIHFNVRDLKRMLGTLGQLFDFDVTPVGEIREHGFFNASGSLRGADAGQPFLDLFQPSTPDGEVGRMLAERGPAVSYIAFRVDDIEAAAAHAAACGLKEVSRVGYRGMRQVQYDTLELLGFHLELVAYEPGFHEELEGIKARLRDGETVDGLRYVDL